MHLHLENHPRLLHLELRILLVVHLGDILVHALGGALDGVRSDKPEADLREGTATFPFLSCVKS